MNLVTHRFKSAACGKMKEVARCCLAPWPLRRLEAAWLSRCEGLQATPVFITGPPRSGTTLFYQCFVQAFRPAYFSNLAARFYRTPVTACWVSQKLPRRDNRSFESDYGVSRGVGAPHEAGSIWNRWFPHEDLGAHYTPEQHLSAKVQSEIAQTVAATEMVFGRPFVNKNVKHAVRIRALDEIFPKCVFLTLTRNRLAVAKSILRGWRHRLGNGREWWSVKPSEYQSLLHKDVVERVCGQIHYLEEDIARDSEAVGRHRFFQVNYEDFCREPLELLKQIEEFLNSHAIDLKLRGEETVPKEFTISNGGACPQNDERALAEALESYECMSKV